MLYAALLFVTLAQGPDLSKTITFECSPTRSELVVKALSKEAGFPLSTSQAMADEVLVIRVKDVPLGEVLTRIAGAVHGSWEQEKTVLRLIRTASKEQQLRADEIAIQKQIYQHGIDGNRSLLAELKPFTKEDAKKLLEDMLKFNAVRGVPENRWSARRQEAMTLAARSPLAKLPPKLLATFDADTIARMQPGTWVFSNRPTAMESRLPKGAERALAEVAVEQTTWAQTIEDGLPAGYEVPPEYGALNIAADNKQFSGQTTIILTLTKVAVDYPAVLARVLLLDEKGKILHSSGGQISAVSTVEYEKLAKLPPKPAVRIPREARYLMMADGARDPVTPEERRVLLATQEADPLRYTHASGLLSYSQERNLNLVACCTDALVSQARNTYYVEEIPASLFRQKFAPWVQAQPFNWEEKDGWLTVTPRFPLAARTNRLNRSALGVLLKAIEEQGMADLDAWADFASKQPTSLAPYSVAVQLGSIINPELPVLQNLPYPFTELYGYLTPQQRAAVWTAEGMPISSLSATQKSVLNYFVFYSAAPLPLQSLTAMPFQSMPTRLLRSGIDPKAVIRGTYRSSMSILAKADKLPTRLFTAATYARHLKESGSSEYQSFRQVVKWECELRLDLAPGVISSGELTFTTGGAAKEYVSYDRLPAEFRDAVQAELNRLQ